MSLVQRFLAALTTPTDDTELAELRDRCVTATLELRRLTDSNARLTGRNLQLQNDLVAALDRAETAEADLHRDCPPGTREAVRVAHYQEVAQLWQDRYEQERRERGQLVAQVEALRADNQALRATARGAAA